MSTSERVKPTAEMVKRPSKTGRLKDRQNLKPVPVVVFDKAISVLVKKLIQFVGL